MVSGNRDFGIDFEPCSKRFVSLILKSSNLDKINDASYPNLSCGNDSDY